jgi:hypothetical protein
MELYFLMNDEPIFLIENELVGRAKLRVARWFDLTEEPTKIRAKVLSGVEAIAREMPHRADWFEVITVGLDDSENLALQVNTPQYRAFPCRRCLAVSSIVPGWGFGWHKVLKNEEVYQILSWFLHYARQYIHRSYVARLLMVVWEEHGKVLHPFGSQGIIYQRYGSFIAMISADHVLDAARREALKEWGENNSSSVITPETSPWITRNTLDPYLHQAVFHFLRAQNLNSSDFETEAVVAFDCVMQSISAFIRSRCDLSTEPTRGEVCERLGLSAESAELAEYAYFIRNNFGAHAGGWRWWDQSELLNDEA